MMFLLGQLARVVLRLRRETPCLLMRLRGELTGSGQELP